MKLPSSTKTKNFALEQKIIHFAGAISTSDETVFGARIRFTCPEGQIFATGVDKVDTRCMPGGKWSVEYVPKCQQVTLPIYMLPVSCST